VVIIVEINRLSLCLMKLGETPLYRSVCAGHSVVCSLLLERGADVNTRDKVRVLER
jgi:hypothetical protein